MSNITNLEKVFGGIFRKLCVYWWVLGFGLERENEIFIISVDFLSTNPYYDRFSFNSEQFANVIKFGIDYLTVCQSREHIVSMTRPRGKSEIETSIQTSKQIEVEVTIYL
jgi:hypothetical protein